MQCWRLFGGCLDTPPRSSVLTGLVDVAAWSDLWACSPLLWYVCSWSYMEASGGWFNLDLAPQPSYSVLWSYCPSGDVSLCNTPILSIFEYLFGMISCIKSYLICDIMYDIMYDITFLVNNISDSHKEVSLVFQHVWAHLADPRQNHATSWRTHAHDRTPQATSACPASTFAQWPPCLGARPSFRASLVATVTLQFHTTSRTICVLVLLDMPLPTRSTTGVTVAMAGSTRWTSGCGVMAGAALGWCPSLRLRGSGLSVWESRTGQQRWGSVAARPLPPAKFHQWNNVISILSKLCVLNIFLICLNLSMYICHKNIKHLSKYADSGTVPIFIWICLNSI